MKNRSDTAHKSSCRGHVPSILHLLWLLHPLRSSLPLLLPSCCHSDSSGTYSKQLTDQKKIPRFTWMLTAVNEPQMDCPAAVFGTACSCLRQISLLVYAFIHFTIMCVVPVKLSAPTLKYPVLKSQRNLFYYNNAVKKNKTFLLHLLRLYFLGYFSFYFYSANNNHFIIHQTS